ncbi:hypothetical protein M0R45_030662 [Rubus argutus]|uniref:Secreted protein n=1 Tax=Rubus argutus TaxID=59490 RepID=A0AAW1WEY2_RUBAR
MLSVLLRHRPAMAALLPVMPLISVPRRDHLTGPSPCPAIQSFAATSLASAAGDSSFLDRSSCCNRCRPFFRRIFSVPHCPPSLTGSLSE